MVVERADTPSRARCDVRSNVRARFLNALFGGALFGLVDTHITMASAAMRFAAATGRGNFSAPGNNPARDRAPVAQAALGGRRNALRAALRARSAAPTRFARGGVMPVNAKHTAVPEAQVRRLTRKIAAPSFLCNNRPRPRFASAREGGHGPRTALPGARPAPRHRSATERRARKPSSPNPSDRAQPTTLPRSPSPLGTFAFPSFETTGNSRTVGASRFRSIGKTPFSFH